MIPVTERIRQSMVSLHMARALETLDQTLSRLEKGEISAIEAIDALLAEELNLREGRRIGVALRTARLMPIKTLESFDFSFQPSLDRHRIMALAQLEFIKRAEVLHFLGPPGTGKSHLATAIGVAAVKAGRSVGILAGSLLLGCSSAETVVVPLRPFTSTATISRSNAPDACAFCARVSEAIANASCASRVN